MHGAMPIGLAFSRLKHLRETDIKRIALPENRMSSRERMPDAAVLLLTTPSLDVASVRNSGARQSVDRVTDGRAADASWPAPRPLSKKAGAAMMRFTCLESATLVKPLHLLQDLHLPATAESAALVTVFQVSLRGDGPWHRPCERLAQTTWFNCAPRVKCLALRRRRPSTTNLNRDSGQNSFGCQQRERLEAEARCCRPVRSEHQPPPKLRKGETNKRTEGTEQRT